MQRDRNNATKRTTIFSVAVLLLAATTMSAHAATITVTNTNDSGPGSWEGRSRASIRKFVVTDRYTGPTKSGMSLDGPTVAQLLIALRKLQSVVPTNGQDYFISACNADDWEIRVGIVPPDEQHELPSVDIREFVNTPRYSGPTKAGVRFIVHRLVRKCFLALFTRSSKLRETWSALNSSFSVGLRRRLQ